MHATDNLWMLLAQADNTANPQGKTFCTSMGVNSQPIPKQTNKHRYQRQKLQIDPNATVCSHFSKNMR